jgi:dihydroflavonol-4-reductase
MRIFLTGGTGFIGQALVPWLLALGGELQVLVRNPTAPAAKALECQGVRLIPGDLTHMTAICSAMSGAGLVIHNAGHYEFGVDAAGRRRMHATNVTGTNAVLGAALELGIPRSIYVSTVQAFGDSGSELRDETYQRQTRYFTYYEETKTEAHCLATDYQERGLPLIIVCPNGVIGANDHSAWGYFLRLYLNDLTPPYGWTPDCKYSLVDVDDLAEGIALAAVKGRLNETYLLTGESKTRREHLSYWASRMDKRPFRIFLPAWLAALTCAPLEPLQRRAGIPAFISRETVRGSIPQFNYSSEKAQREFGWQPRSAQEMWYKAIDGELALLAARQDRGLVSRLRPVAEPSAVLEPLG